MRRRATWLLPMAWVCGTTLAMLAACGSFSAAPAEVLTGDGGGIEAASDGGSPIPCDPTATSKDALNCGKCGHSCLGGDCQQGTCQPRVLATAGSDTILDVVVDRTRIVWTSSKAVWENGAGVFSCPLDGCGAGVAPTSLYAGGSAVGSLTSNEQDVYVTFLFPPDQGIGKLTDAIAAIAPLAHHTFPIRVQHGPSLYFLARYELADGGLGNSSPGSGTVYAWDGTKETPLASFDMNNFTDLVVTGNHIFVSGYGLILSCDIGSTCPMLQPFFTDDATGIRSLTTDGSRLYWSSVSGHAVLSCSVSGTCDTPQRNLSLNGADALSVTFAHGVLYVTTSTGNILPCDPSVDCGGVTPLVRAEQLYDGDEYTFGHSLTADAKAVYWADKDPAGAAHRIMMLAK